MPLGIWLAIMLLCGCTSTIAIELGERRAIAVGNDPDSMKWFVVVVGILAMAALTNGLAIVRKSGEVATGVTPEEDPETAVAGMSCGWVIVFLTLLGGIAFAYMLISGGFASQ